MRVVSQPPHEEVQTARNRQVQEQNVQECQLVLTVLSSRQAALRERRLTTTVVRMRGQGYLKCSRRARGHLALTSLSLACDNLIGGLSSLKSRVSFLISCKLAR